MAGSFHGGGPPRIFLRRHGKETSCLRGCKTERLGISQCAGLGRDPSPTVQAERRRLHYLVKVMGCKNDRQKDKRAEEG